jgi:hypothetical protein
VVIFLKDAAQNSPSPTSAPEFEPARWLCTRHRGAVVLVLTLYQHAELPFQDDVIHCAGVVSHRDDPRLTAEICRPTGWGIAEADDDAGHNVPPVLRLQNILACAERRVDRGFVLRLDSTRRRYVVAGLAAVLFAALPFAYQAVIWINVFFYPLGTLLLLLSALTYFQARTTGRTRWLILTWLWCFLAPAEIEWGLMSGALLFGLEIVWWLQKQSRRPWLVGPIGALTLNVIFFIIWKIVPKFDYSRGMVINVESIMQIGAYYLQGLTYPTAPLANLLVGQAGQTISPRLRRCARFILALLIWRRRTLPAAG